MMTVIKRIPLYHRQMLLQKKVFKTKHIKLHLKCLEELIEYKLQYDRVNKLKNSCCTPDIITVGQLRKN